MSLSRRRKALSVAAGVTAFALLVAGCGDSKDDALTTSAAAPSSAVEPITLRLATLNGADYGDDLLQEYMDLHPNVTIVQDVAATPASARTNYFDKLGTAGLSDVEAIDSDWLPEVMQHSDLLADLSSPGVEGRWLGWTTAAATDANGRLIGYGTGIDPEAVCYDSALFADAGLPTDPADVAMLLEGGWDRYFKTGQQYNDATGKAWFDSTGAIYEGMISQVQAAYEDPSTGATTATTNPDVKAIFDRLTAASSALSAHVVQGSDAWGAGMAKGDFATVLCPASMLDVIKDAAPNATTWNVADVFPGGGGNRGSAYLTVPGDGKNVDAARDLAAWLTAPQQQVRALASRGTFPSQVAALSDEISLNAIMSTGSAATNPAFFHSDTLGTLFKNRASAITVLPFKGRHYFAINDAMQNALTRVEDGSQDSSASWTQFVSEVDALD